MTSILDKHETSASSELRGRELVSAGDLTQKLRFLTESVSE